MGRDAQFGQPLTERELNVLQGMARGLSNSGIGGELYVSEDTVKVHARRLFQKLGARDRAHAVSLGYTQRLLAVDAEAPTDARIELQDCERHVELCAFAFFADTVSPTLARHRAQEGLRRLLATVARP